MQGDLTTLAHVQAWVGSSTGGKAPGSDASAILSRLITACSATAMSYMGRTSLAVHDVTETYDIYGGGRLVLRQFPVLSIGNLSVGGSTPVAPADLTKWPPSSGYELEAPIVGGGGQRVNLYGALYPTGQGGVRVTYTVGFKAVEPQIVPALVDQGTLLYQTFALFTSLGDIGVTLANGTALTKVAGVPGPGQYAENGAGTYTFNAAQAGAAVIATYSYVPADIDNAVCQMVGEDYMRRTRIGITSMSVGGQETVAYSLKDISDRAKLDLKMYRSVV